MMLDAFPSGESCFVDANVLVYAAVELGPFTQRCRSFLERVAAGEILASTSDGAVADALHRIMVMEITRRFLPPGAKALSFLQKHPEILEHLSHVPAAAEGLARLPLRLLETDWQTIRSTAQISVQNRLLTGDALIVALMRRHGVTHLATNDDDFDSVPGFTVWKPR